MITRPTKASHTNSTVAQIKLILIIACGAVRWIVKAFFPFCSLQVLHKMILKMTLHTTTLTTCLYIYNL